MRRRASREINIFSFSFIDVLACTVGFLIFILVTLAVLTANLVKPPSENKISNSLIKHQKQVKNLDAKNVGLKARYQRVEKRFLDLKDRQKWVNRIPNWVFYLLIFFIIWLVILVSNEYFKKPKIKYTDYVFKSSTPPPGGHRYTVECYSDRIIIKDTGGTVLVSSLERGRETPFHDLCRSLKANDRIYIIMRKGGNRGYIAANNVINKLGVGSKCILNVAE